jgi:ADP-ribose pyrophosphatase YjhB (NUDIX family)
MNDSEKNNNEIISCGAIVVDDNKILLIRQFKNSDLWGIPKGHLEKDETFVECAKREVKEETGIDVSISEKVGELKFQISDKIKNVIIFSGKALNGNTTDLSHPSSEVAEAKWFDKNKLPKLVRYQSKLIKDYIYSNERISKTV